MKFERGVDPMDNMDIGIRRTLPILKERYEKLTKHLDRYRNQNWAESYINELWKSRPQRFVAECGWRNMIIIFEKITKEEYGIIYDIVEKQCKSLKL